MPSSTSSMQLDTAPERRLIAFVTIQRAATLDVCFQLTFPYDVATCILDSSTADPDLAFYEGTKNLPNSEPTTRLP
jgi:hypothetical protein